MTEIGENKFLQVTYGALVVVATSVIGFTMWLSSISSKAEANNIHIQEIKSDRKMELELLQALDRRTARMEGYLKALVPNKEGE